MSMVKIRQMVEREIATAVVDTLFDAGYSLSTDYGDGESIVFKTKTGILNALFQGDEDRMYTYKDGECVGWVYFVYGNDGWDVISDYTVNLEKLIGAEGSRVQKIVNKYSD